MTINASTMIENSKQLLLFCGLPKQGDNIAAFRKDGGSVIYFIQPDQKDELVFRPGDRAILWESDEKVKRWLHENAPQWIGAQIGGDEGIAQQLAQLLGQIVDLHNFDQSSLEFLTKDAMPTRNALRNFRYLEDGIPLKRAKGMGKGHAAILMMAGPSLDAQWGELRRLRCVDQHVFICAGRTYRKAMQEQVPPDFVIEVEQFPWDDKIFTFAAPPPDHAILCAPLTTCPGVLRAWPGKRMILTDHNTAKLFESEGFKVGEDSIDGGNSILHHAFNLSLWLGCNPILFAGVDLGYPQGETQPETHASGTFPPWPNEILTCERNLQDPLTVEGNDGQPLRSSPGYKNFALFCEMQVQKAKSADPDLRVFTFSPRGQKMSGVDSIPIHTWRNGLCSPASSSPGSSPAASQADSSAASGSATC